WLPFDLTGVEKDPTLFPSFDAQTAADLTESMRLFILDIFYGENPTIENLLTAPFAYVNARTAPIFGVAPVEGDDFVRVDLDPTERAGILTQPALLARHAHGDQTSPVLRGLMVRERFLCGHIPAPPDDVAATVPEIDPNLTTRQRFAQHRADPQCSTCHEMMDPLGFALETYDATGAFRSEEHGEPIDTTGMITSTRATNGEFDDAVDLAHTLAQSEDVRSCISKTFFRFAMGTEPGPDLSCTQGAVDEALARSGGSLRDMVLAWITSDPFLFRSDPGAAP
ncbi:MAG: DUF1588 domain-containing protein, partial [Myxococcales bacterium]|nr:DUF1588 domain-containing protein [Myxococcales bacterium]